MVGCPRSWTARSNWMVSPASALEFGLLLDDVVLALPDEPLRPIGLRVGVAGQVGGPLLMALTSPGLMTVCVRGCLWMWVKLASGTTALLSLAGL